MLSKVYEIDFRMKIIKKFSFKESITTELDREIEHEIQIMNNTTTKHVTIVEPPIRPTTSIDDFSRTAKTASGKYRQKTKQSLQSLPIS